MLNDDEIPTLKIDRLMLLREAVANAPPERFDMGNFGMVKSGCGTCHCAFGWYVAAGHCEGVMFELTAHRLGRLEMVNDVGTPVSEFGVAQYEFGLMWGQMRELFTEKTCTLHPETRDEWLNRLDAFIENVTENTHADQSTSTT